MENRIDHILKAIGAQFENMIAGDARHYLEASLGELAAELGLNGVEHRLKDVPVIVPLKQPLGGMKVRIDGRTFKNYRQFDTGIAVPGYLASESGLPGRNYIPHDSMIRNFS